MKIKELFDHPTKWTKTFTAKDKNGSPVPSDSNFAVSWCISGAVMRCYRMEDRLAINNLIRKYLYEHNLAKVNSLISYWNDSKDTTFDDVMTLVNELDI